MHPRSDGATRAHSLATGGSCGVGLTLAKPQISILGLATLARLGISPPEAPAFRVMNPLVRLAYGLVCSVPVPGSTSRLGQRAVRQNAASASSESLASRESVRGDAPGGNGARRSS